MMTMTNILVIAMKEIVAEDTNVLNVSINNSDVDDDDYDYDDNDDDGDNTYT